MTIELRSVITKTTSTVKSKERSPSKQDGAAKSVDSQSDSVNLSSTAFSIHQAEQALAAVPIVNSVHVEAVSDALNKGNYEVNAEQVAVKIIELERELPE